MTDPIFDHEKLRVYQEAILFVTWWTSTADRAPGRLAVRDQIDRASTSIPLNIAEGNAKQSPRERCHYLDIACGSAFECAAGLDVLVAQGKLAATDANTGKRHLHAIVGMLRKLRNSVADRVSDAQVEYDSGGLSE
ncbi:MAG: four helix bundle protein [Armatimonadota bacterium]